MEKLINFCAGAEWKKRPENVSAILFNAPEHSSTPHRIEKAKLLCQSAQPTYLMSDSGGYQLLDAEIKKWKITHDPDCPLVYRHNSKEINLAPKHVMEFASLLKSDVVFSLDFPVGKFKTAAEREIEFYKKLPLNVRWAYESATWKMKLCPEAKLFQPIQAYNLKHLDIFFSRIAGLQYGGVGIPVREVKFYEIALFLTSFYQRGIDRVHLLGTASFLKIAIAAFMANNMFEWVSLDSAKWNKAAFRCGFLNPKNLSSIDLRISVKLDPRIVNDCRCPYCQSQSFKKIQSLPNKEKFELLRQHNWWAIDKAVTNLYANSTDLLQLERFLKHRGIKPADIDNLINTLSLVDCLKDDDIEVLQTILAPVPRSRKSSRRPRKLTDPNSRPRKPTRISRHQTEPTSRSTLFYAASVGQEQNEKVSQEVENHVY